MTAVHAARCEAARRTSAEMRQLALNSHHVLALLEQARGGDGDWDLGLRLAHVLARDLDLVLAPEPELARHHTVALATRRLRLVVDPVAPSGHVIAGARVVAGALDRAVAVADVRLLELERPALPYPAPEPAPAAPAHRAVRVSAAAVRLLPPAHRPRYREEFLGELQELADDGRSRRDQLGHAVRLLTRALSLRRAVGAPHPARRTS